jgi:restriction system protein
MDKLIDIIEGLDVEVPNRGYYYLRTDGGVYYDEYRDNDYVAINYNYVHPSAIASNNVEQLKKLITTNDSKFENIEYSDLDRGKKSTVSKYIGILQKFEGMKLGDVVIIPSSDSTSFSIGLIDDNNIFLPQEKDLKECNYTLRRKVKWKKIDAYIPEYSPILYSLKHSHLALTKLEKHSEYINGILSPLFLQNDKFYFTLNIDKEEDIPLFDLKNLLESYCNILTILNEEYNFNEDIGKSIIKLNLNSKGKVNLIQKKGVNSTKAIASAAICIMLLGSCSSDEIQKSTGFSNEKAIELRKELDVINDSKATLEISDEDVIGI